MLKIKINKLILLAVAAITLVFPAVTAAQETVTIPIEDLRQFRKAVADAVFWEKTAKDKEDQIKAANDSAISWKGLYLSEKDRADRVQEKRATEATSAATSFQQANFELREQNTELKREKRDLEDKVTSLKSSRKWYFGAGVVTGGAVGFFGGRQTCSASFPALLARPAENRQFGFKIPF